MISITPEIVRMIENAGRGSKRRARARKSLVTRPRVSPDAAAQLDRVVSELATTTDSHRRAMTASILVTAAPANLVLVVDAIIRRLNRSRKTSVRCALADSLVMLGPPAAAPVARALFASKAGRQQADLARVLERLAPVVPTRDLTMLVVQLLVKHAAASDPAAADAIARAVAAARVAIEHPRKQD